MKFFRFILLLFIIPLFGAQDRHSIFLGMGLGIKKSIYYAPSWQIFGGYEYRPFKQFGLMSYVQSLLAIKPQGLSTIVSNQISLNSDFIAGIPLGNMVMLEPYIGIGFGYALSSETLMGQIQSQYPLLLNNVGLQVIIDENNLLRLGVAFSLNFYTKRYETIQALLSYAYKF